MIRNFLFHRVNTKRDPLWDPMDIALFDKCIKYITENYKIALIEDLAFSPELHSKHEYATIMFDDGYKDNILYAAPILDKYKCKASFYVVTDCIDRNIPVWTLMLEHAFQYTNINELNLNFDFFPEDLKIKKLTNLKERINYLNKLKPFLRKTSHEDRNAVIEAVISTYKDVEMPKLMMNWKDIKELMNAGHYIGSHTLSHSMLGTMSDEADITNELLASAKSIEKNLGHFPVSIAYPVGSYNDVSKRISKELGYKIGLAVNQNIFDPKKQDFFEMSRIELYNEPWWKTRLRITHSLEKIKSVIGYK